MGYNSATRVSDGVGPLKNGAIQGQDGKELKVSPVTPHGLNVNVALPCGTVKTIKGLKRVEIKMAASAVKDRKGEIKVRLAGSEKFATYSSS